LIPCRRATAETFAPGWAASATIACFSVSFHFRRVSATIEYRREKLSPDIGTDIAPAGINSRNKSYIQSTPQGGPRRRLTQRFAVEGDCSIQDLVEEPERALLDGEADLLPWVISFWSISCSPDGEEDCYAVRRLEIGSDGVRPPLEIQVASSLDEARRLIPSGLRRFSRHPLDDPSVVEVWI
jgi:hypothetical protein